MFTGIITNIGNIKEIIPQGTEREIVLSTDLNADDLTLGQSIACNGACLTISKFSGSDLHFFVSNETLDKTNMSNWQVGDKINLELAMAANSRFDGHIVTGHIDGVAKINSIESSNNSHIITVDLPNGYENFIVEKGSIAINGISLTVNEVNANQFTVTIIPHSWDFTNLNRLVVGDEINFELDIIAKYINKIHGK